MSTDTNEPTWPMSLLDPSEVCSWIATALADHSGPVGVSGPEEIYQNKGWGVTACFTVKPLAMSRTRTRCAGNHYETNVVFKASALPLFAHAPAVYELLMLHVPQQVPALLAWSRFGNQTRTLFSQFKGEPISGKASLSDLEDIARTMARIQVEIARLPKETKSGLPHLTISDIPVLFDEILTDIRERHLTAWNADEQTIMRRFNLPAHPFDIFASYRKSVRAWTDELEAGSWPESIDHVDLQSDNAIRLIDGSILIYDWEEAGVSCPFFSIDRLLDDARELGVSTAERAVRDAYINALPWHTPTERNRALDLALCLSPLKLAYECKRFTNALGREQAFSRLTAFCMSRALQRWQAMDVVGSG